MAAKTVKHGGSFREYLATHPLFNREELLGELLKGGRRSPRTVDSLLAYYVRRGRLVAVRRGLHVVVPFGTEAAGFSIDPLLVAAKAADDAILAYHTALEWHGKAHSAFSIAFFLTRRAVRPFRFRGSTFRPVRVERLNTTGLLKHARGGITARVTTLERTLVDVLDRPDLAGGWEEVWRSLESVEFFELDAVVKYALQLKNATSVAKVGFYLQQHREVLMVEDAHLSRLKAHRPRSPHYLDRSNRKGGRFVADWNLVVPPAVYDRSWEEPR